MKECEICNQEYLEDEMIFYDCNGCPVSSDFDDIAYQVCGVCNDELDISSDNSL